MTAVESAESTAPIPGRAPRSGHIRIYADPAGAAELMRHIIGTRLCDALLGEEGGHWYVDVRDGDGILRELVDLLAAAMELGQIGYAMLCVDGRTFTFQPDTARRPTPGELAYPNRSGGRIDLSAVPGV